MPARRWNRVLSVAILGFLPTVAGCEEDLIFEAKNVVLNFAVLPGQDPVPGGLAGGSATIPAPSTKLDSLRITLSNLELLSDTASTKYLFWLVDTAGAFAAANARVITTRKIDTLTTTDTTDVSQGVGGGSNTSYSLLVDSSRVGAALRPYTFFVVTIGGDPATAGAKPLWARFAKDSAGIRVRQAATVTLNLGAFHPDSTQADLFARSGSGTGGFLGNVDNASGTFVADSVVVVFRRLDQPPMGYYYQGWLLKISRRVVESATPTACLRASGASAPADCVELSSLGNGSDRVSSAQVAPATGSNFYALTLEATAGAAGTSPMAVQVSADLTKFGQVQYPSGP